MLADLKDSPGILFLDTVSGEFRAELYQGEEKIFSFHKDTRTGSAEFMQALATQFSKLEFSLSKLAFNRGPGSFTGIKLGYVFARSQEFASNVSLYSFTSFDLMELLAGKKSKNSAFYLYAFQDEYFRARRSGSGWEYSVVARSSIEDTSPGYYMGNPAFKLDNFEQLNSIDMPDLIELFKKERLSQEIDPLYLKKSTAERNLQARIVLNKA